MARKLESWDAWLALVASTLIYMLTCIPDGSFGILYDYLIPIYDASRTSIGWALSLYWVFIYLAGLLFSPIIDMYGCRVLSFVGAILYGSGISLSCITTTLPGFYVAYGVLGGLGCGSLYIASSTIIQQKFIYNRGFANGMSSLGFSIGAVIHPLHTVYFMDKFGVRGTFLIHGALIFHALVFSFALKTPRTFKAKDANLNLTNTNSKCAVDAKNLSSELKINETLSKNDDTVDHDVQVGESQALTCKTVDNTVVFSEEHLVEQSDNLENEKCNSLMHSDTSPEGCEIAENPSSQNCVQQSKDHDEQIHHKNFLKCIKLKNYFLRMLDFSLVKNAVFMLSTLHFLLLWMARLSIMAQIVSCAIHRDIDSDRAAYLLSISGFGNLCMRLICAVVMNFSWMDPILFSGLASVFVVISGFMAAFSKTYIMFAITMVLMGMSEAIAMANLPQLVVHIIGVTRFPRGIALFWTLMLPTPFGAVPLSGWLVDMTGQYLIAFLVIGVEGIVSTLLAVIVYLLFRRQQNQARQKSTTNFKDIVI